MDKVNFLNYLTDAVEDKIMALVSFKGYVSERDICEIINNQTGMSLEGSETIVYTANELGLEK